MRSPISASSVSVGGISVGAMVRNLVIGLDAVLKGICVTFGS